MQSRKFIMIAGLNVMNVCAFYVQRHLFLTISKVLLDINDTIVFKKHKKKNGLEETSFKEFTLHLYRLKYESLVQYFGKMKELH